MQKAHFYFLTGVLGFLCFAQEATAQMQTSYENGTPPYRLTGSRVAPMHPVQTEQRKAQIKAAVQGSPKSERLNQTQKQLIRERAVKREQLNIQKQKSLPEKGSDTWEKTKDVTAEKWSDVKDATADTWEKTKDVTAEKWSDVKDATADTWEKTKDVTAEKWQDVKEGTKEKWQNMTETNEEKASRLHQKALQKTHDVHHPVKGAAHKKIPIKPVVKESGKPLSLWQNIKGRNGGDVLKNNVDVPENTCLNGKSGGDVPVLGADETTHPVPIVHGKTARGRKATSPSFLSRADKDVNSWANAYAQAKNELLKETGLSYTLDVSLMGQRGAPSGHITPWQTQYYGAATWDMFQSDTWGSGSANLAYELVRYWNGNGAELGSNIGVVTPLNDYTAKANYFYELSYTHQMPGKLNWLSVTLGQFPMYNFDGTTYDSNQQINFVNESFAQNATSTYPSASLGGYLTLSPDPFWSISVGGQDARNIDGNNISTNHWGKKFTSFISGTINPKNKLGQATLSVLLYNQPSVDEQPEKTRGWSVNAQQNMGKKLAIFMRANGVNKGVNGISQSYVLGGVYNNPLNRNALDQIGFAGAVNKLDKGVNGAGSRSVENMLEAYWAWGISSFMTITPDVQFYINPGLNQKSNTATVASIRATMMF